jgi:hypothetical protein
MSRTEANRTAQAVATITWLRYESDVEKRAGNLDRSKELHDLAERTREMFADRIQKRIDARTTRWAKGGA